MNHYFVSKRAKYSTGDGWTGFIEPDGEALTHEYYRLHLKDELDEITHDHLRGPFMELVYPRDDNFHESDHFEGEFDVFMETDDYLIVYELKSGDSKSFKSSLSQYNRAQNYAAYLGKGLDFNVFHVGEIFTSLSQVIEDSNPVVQDDYPDLDFISNNHLERNFNHGEIGDFVKGGVFSKPEWLLEGFRHSDETASRYDFEKLEELGLITQEDHVKIGTEELEELLEGTENQLLMVSPFWNSFYSKYEMDEMIDETALKHI